MQVAAGTNSPLHATPAVVGRLAQNARVRRLIVSHIGLAGPVLEAAIADLKTGYTGPLTVGADLQCTRIR
jgi:ribonuclease BN (tRNA processing enzyme)